MSQISDGLYSLNQASLKAPTCPRLKGAEQKGHGERDLISPSRSGSHLGGRQLSALQISHKLWIAKMKPLALPL